MKKYKEETTIKVEYEYVSEKERKLHLKTMRKDGWEIYNCFEISDGDGDENDNWKPAAAFYKTI